MINIKHEIERLINFSLQQGLIEKWDCHQVRNGLMDLLKVEEPFEGELEAEELEVPVQILENILDYCAEEGILPENTTTFRDLMDAKIMGLLMPRSSEVVKNFNKLSEDSVEKATDYFYHLSQVSNYIRTDRIAKNQYFRASTEFGDLEITINLSKPEKDPKEIEKAKHMPQASYPKCLLCVENVGYAGRINHPGRQNHRVIPIELKNEQWYMQYSPYVYYNEHSIIFNGQHVPMKISRDTFTRLLDFTERMPHYFLGSNADLPIVGGSILSHDHFQGGHHTFPMEVAGLRETFESKKYSNINIGIVNWQMSVIRLSSNNKENLVEFASQVLNLWRAYSDEQVDILAYTDSDGEKIPHNTITPIARRNKEGLYELDLVLRNNRRTEQHPDGLFHPHSHLHHIKKENIGLIEVMGLAVLPGRLKAELSKVQEVLSGKIDMENLNEADKALLGKHEVWLKTLVKEFGTQLTEEASTQLVEKEVGRIFSEVLECAGVYKKDSKGQEAFERFVKHCIDTVDML